MFPRSTRIKIENSPKLMVFKNIRLCFSGSDDFEKDEKIAAAKDLKVELEAGRWGSRPRNSAG
jgi:hypothetical protein